MLERHTYFPIPSLDPVDLPVAVHRCLLEKALAKLGRENLRRRALGDKLSKVFNAALSTGHLTRFIVIGSFVTAKEGPNDIDIFLMMDDEFETTHKKRMTASFDFHLIPDEVRKNQIGCPHLALLN